jgi:hypothetical protein
VSTLSAADIRKARKELSSAQLRMLERLAKYDIPRAWLHGHEHNTMNSLTRRSLARWVKSSSSYRITAGGKAVAA